MKRPSNSKEKNRSKNQRKPLITSFLYIDRYNFPSKRKKHSTTIPVPLLTEKKNVKIINNDDDELYRKKNPQKKKPNSGFPSLTIIII